MKFADLSPETIEKIKTYRWDRILEKHEGPEKWESELKWGEPEFMVADGYNVLLPLDPERRPNVTFLRVIPSTDGQSLTLFIKDNTFADDPDWEFFSAGFLSICEKVPGEEFYIAVAYHEWFMLPTPQDPSNPLPG